MNEHIEDAEFLFVVDTDSYSGNFEREMCAYITGVTGEYDVGEEYSLEADKELAEKQIDWFNENICHLADDHGCLRPVSIYPTEGYFNDGNGKHFKDTDVFKGKLYQGKKWPAYQSVAIQFSKKPTKDILRLMVERAYKFSEKEQKYCDKIRVTGWRLVQNKVTIETKILERGGNEN